MNFRKIRATDNEALAKIIRSSLKAHGLDIPGTVYTDPTTDDLSTLFQTPNSVYFVAEEHGEILGGCGIYPTEGLPEGYVELVKLYLVDRVRGQGLGRKLMEESINWARDKGFTHVYLETFAELAAAVTLYEKLGFQSLKAPLGNSGHTACTIWMVKEL